LEAAAAGGFADWRATPSGTLALLILLDQFPRNMFRGSARAFASDARALEVAKYALDRDLDAGVAGDPRQFFYLPLMHSEILADQERSVRRFLLGLPSEHNLRHARAHRLVIRRFGRFPYRNAALGRRSTPAETAFLEAGGYAAALAELG
jgi:uncharacterized protein (DUF924 family)